MTVSRGGFSLRGFLAGLLGSKKHFLQRKSASRSLKR